MTYQSINSSSIKQYTLLIKTLYTINQVKLVQVKWRASIIVIEELVQSGVFNIRVELWSFHSKWGLNLIVSLISLHVHSMANWKAHIDGKWRPYKNKKQFATFSNNIFRSSLSNNFKFTKVLDLWSERSILIHYFILIANMTTNQGGSNYDE